jgi:PAS domain S-box-containing protein
MLGALFNAITESVLLTDGEGTLLTCNETAARRLGRPVEELLGQKLLNADPDVVPRQVAHERMELIRRVIESRRALRVEDRRNGVVMDHSLYPVFDDQGAVSQVAIFSKDVTHQRETERALHESERRYTYLLENMGEIVATFDLDGRCTSVNQAVRTLLGYEVGEVVGRRFSELVSPEAVAELEIPYGRVLAGEPVKGQTVLLHRTGRRVDVEYHVVPVIRDERVVAMQGLTWDITERKSLERMLRESEERYRAVVESAGEAISIVDQAGTFRFMNRTAAQAFGAQPSDLIGKTMWDLFPAEFADRQAGTVRRVIRTGEAVNTIVLSKTGEQARWYNTTVAPLRDSQGVVTAGLVIARDIHELRTAQQELDAYREKMVRAEQLASLGTLGAMLAHELTQPLTVIRLSMQNALEDLATAGVPARVTEDLRDGLDEVANATAIVNRIRGFAQRTSEKAVKEVVLSAVAQRVIRLLEQSAPRAKVRFDIEQLADLPSIHTHEKNLEQVFFALAQNAVQAAGGSDECELTIDGVRRGDRVELRFADTCGGIAPENLDRIFDPFFTTKPPGEGTGLGLCIVQRIVSQIGGDLHVESQWGHGTTFTILLPIDRR